MPLITRVRPQVGDTSIHDLVSETDFTGSGTISLVDVGAEKAWNITAASTYTLATAIKNIQGSVDGAGATIAARFRQNVAGTNSFMPFVGIGSTTQGMRLMRNGVNYRGRILTSSAEANTSGVTILGQIVTIVYKIRTVSSGTDSGALWIGGLARTGNDPNFVGAGVNLAANNNIQTAFINVTDSADYDLLDFVYYDEELPDADCASMADDIVGFFGGGGTVTSTIAASIPKPTASANITIESSTITFTVGASIPKPTASAAITVVPASGDPIFTSDPLHDNTDTLLANAPLDYVAIYDNTTGALVLRVTGISTDASGQFSVQSALLTSGVTYKVDWKVTSQLIGRMPTKAAV